MKTTYLIDELKVTVAVLVVEQLLLGIDRVRANRGQHEKHRKGKPQLMHLASDCCDAVPIPPLALLRQKNRRPLYTNEPNKSHAHTHTHKSAPIYSLLPLWFDADAPKTQPLCGICKHSGLAGRMTRFTNTLPSTNANRDAHAC